MRILSLARYHCCNNLKNFNPYRTGKMNDKRNFVTKNTPCPGCGGSGQTSYFAGESRFMLTWEDCPDCSGTGVLLAENDEKDQESSERINRLS